jgi:hypothetical protein
MRKPWIKLLLFFLPMMVTLVGCDLEREVEIELPDYERELVAECFMEVGEPFRLLLTESLGFTEGNDTPIVFGAEVIISHGNVHDTLAQGVYVDPMGYKVFNFNSTQTVPADYATEYSLHISHPDGRVVTGKARIMPKVEIASMSLSYNADSLASLTMRWPDMPNQDNYYRLSLHKGTVFHGQTELPTPLEFDFTLDDRIGDGEFFTIGTLFNYVSGDTLIATLYHIDKGYWQYINSLDDAIGSNGNPFAQPGVIHSTVEGGIGVFTGYQFDRDTIIVP